MIIFGHNRPLTLTRTSFFTKRERTWRGGDPRAIWLLSVIELRDKDHRDSLERSESNGVRVDLFGSTVDLPGQVKLKKIRFPG